MREKKMTTKPWAKDAACRGAPVSLFFPPDPDEGLHRSWQDDLYAMGKRYYCDVCPVRDECLLHALENGEEHGLWGGLTPREREEFMT